MLLAPSRQQYEVALLELVRLRSRRIVDRLLAGALRGLACGRQAAHLYLPDLRLDLLGGNRARPEHYGRLAAQVQHRRFDAHAARPAIEDVVDTRAEFLAHVLGRRRAHPRGSIGAGRCDRPVQFAQKLQRQRMVRAAQPHCSQPRRRFRDDHLRFRHNQSQRPRPEFPRQSSRDLRPVRGVSLRHGLVADMYDQRIGRWPALGLKDARNGRAAGCIRAEAIDGFRGEGHQAAAPQDSCCLANVVHRSLMIVYSVSVVRGPLSVDGSMVR